MLVRQLKQQERKAAEATEAAAAGEGDGEQQEQQEGTGIKAVVLRYGGERGGVCRGCGTKVLCMVLEAGQPPGVKRLHSFSQPFCASESFGPPKHRRLPAVPPHPEPRP